jgi:hypothetical protein
VLESNSSADDVCAANPPVPSAESEADAIPVAPGVPVTVVIDPSGYVYSPVSILPVPPSASLKSPSEKQVSDEFLFSIEQNKKIELFWRFSLDAPLLVSMHKSWPSLYLKQAWFPVHVKDWRAFNFRIKGGSSSSPGQPTESHWPWLASA